MAKFKNLHTDYRGFEVVDVYEGDVHLGTISLHTFVITFQTNLPEGQMKVTTNDSWPESVILRWKNTATKDAKKE